MNLSSVGTLYIPLWSDSPSNYCQFHMQNRFTLILLFLFQSCLNLCDPLDYRAQGFYILHYFLEFAQTHVFESVMPYNYLIFCQPPFLSSIFPSIRFFSNKSALCVRWSKYWNFSFIVNHSNECSGLISFRVDWSISLLPRDSQECFFRTTIRKHKFSGAQPYLWSNSHICGLPW